MENGYLHEKKQIEISNSSYVTISHNRKFLYSITDFGIESYKIVKGGDLQQDQPGLDQRHERLLSLHGL